MTKRFAFVCYRVCLLALQNFVRNAWLTAAAMIAMIIALAFALAGLIFNLTSQNVISDLADHLTISVYLRDDASAEEILTLREDLRQHPNVKAVEYINVDTARRRFLQSYDNQETRQAVEILSDQPVFSRSLEVTAINLDRVSGITEILRSPEYDQVVRSDSFEKLDAQKIVARAYDIQQALMRLSIVLSVVMTCLAFLVILNTMRMAIFSRREEIQIMRLIGAPSSFIRNPYLVEAGLYGLLSGVIATTIVYNLIFVFGSQIQAVPELASSYESFTRTSVILLFGFLAVFSGILVSLLSCAYALRRYLRF